MVNLYDGSTKHVVELSEITERTAGEIIGQIDNDQTKNSKVLSYMGRRLPEDFRLSELNLAESATLRIINTPVQAPEEVHDRKEIEQVAGWFHKMRAEHMLHVFRAFEAKMKEGTYLKEQLKENPALSKDPEAQAILGDFDLLQTYFDPQNPLVDWLSKHPALVVSARAIVKAAFGAAKSYPRGSSTLPPAPPAAALPQITSEQLRQAMQQAFAGGVQGANPLAQAFANLSNPAPPAPAAPEVQRPPAPETYTTQLAQLNEFGFNDLAQNMQALQLADGVVEMALEILVAMREAEND
ncbi:unnamed protein product, partial [Mesorhabditis spiculigera]